jgi:signal transduction histidine kinase
MAKVLPQAKDMKGIEQHVHSVLEDEKIAFSETDRSPAEAKPEWLHAKPRGSASVSASPWASGLLAVAVLSSVSCLLAYFFYGRGLNVAPAVLLFSLLALVAARRESLAASRAEEQRRKLDTVFEQSGISLWLEDWTPVAQELRTLIQSGVLDMRAYFTANPEHMRALRRSVIIKEVNAFSVEMMGAPDKSVFLGSLDVIIPDTDQTFVEWLVAFERGDRLYRSEAHITRPDGRELDVLFTAALPTTFEGFANILVSAWDVTEHKTNQEKLAKTETEIARVSRITTIGALTASLSHELNSPLAAIVSNAEAALRWLRRPEPNMKEAEAAVGQVVADSIRAREVVARTRGFLSNSPNRSSVVDLAEIIRQSISIIDRELRFHHVSLHFDADDPLPPVAADAVQIQQVMVNLMINGAQAMSEATGPRDLTVTVRREPGQLRVAIRDIGRGMDQARLARIFDPFFTTKPDGMGMGLTICKNCIEGHGGKLSVESTLGEGTLFSFTLPLIA